MNPFHGVLAFIIGVLLLVGAVMVAVAVAAAAAEGNWTPLLMVAGVIAFIILLVTLMNAGSRWERRH